MKINSVQAPSTLIPEYIGSSFDAVLEVASNIEAVKVVAENVGTLGVPLASETTTGIAEIATQAEVDQKTNDSHIVTPKKLGAYAAPLVHNHAAATSTEAGFLSATDKQKLDGIASNANNYTHPTSSVTAGTYKSVTVNAQGHITAGTNPTTLAGYGITDALTDAPSDGKTYGRKNAAWTEVTSGGGAATVLWANRPAASATPGGEIIVSDLGYQKMYSDGTNWRPVGGRLRLRSNRGSVATPVASLTDSGVIALPGGNIIIPAGLLTSDATISYYMDALATSISTGSMNVSFSIQVGTSPTATTNNSASAVSNSSISSTNGGQFALSGCINLSAPTKATARTYAGDGVIISVNKTAGSSALTIKDITTNFNTGFTMYVGIALSANADITGSVVTFDVFVEM